MEKNYDGRYEEFVSIRKHGIYDDHYLVKEYDKEKGFRANCLCVDGGGIYFIFDRNRDGNFEMHGLLKGIKDFMGKL